MIEVSFETIDNKEIISTLEADWRKTLSFPNESYDEAQLSWCQHWVIKNKGEIIGYACVSKKNTLYQFYIIPKYLMHGTAVLFQFIKQRGIERGYIGTNNTIYYSLMMHFQKSIEIGGYLFKNMEEVNFEERDVNFRLSEQDELMEIVNLQIASEAFEGEKATEEAKNWLRDYFSDLIGKGVVYILEKENEIIGFLEARTANLGTKTTSLGIVVKPEYRKQGFGSYMLKKGKLISKSRNSEPICTCNVKNISSRKTIEKSGFRILHLFLLVNFK